MLKVNTPYEDNNGVIWEVHNKSIIQDGEVVERYKSNQAALDELQKQLNVDGGQKL